MFDLDAHIRQWRQQFLGDRAFYSSEVEELEWHLRDAIDELYAKGLSEEEAFVIAVHRLGDRRSLRKEYTRGRSLPQRVFRSRPLAATALIVVLMSAVLVLLGTHAVAHVTEGFRLINLTPLLTVTGLAFGVVTFLAMLGWVLIWQADSSVKAA